MVDMCTVVVFGGAGRVGYNAAEKVALYNQGPLNIILVDVVQAKEKLVGLEQKLKETVAAARHDIRVRKITTDQDLSEVLTDASIVINAAGMPRGITVDLDGEQVTLETRDQLNKANANITRELAHLVGKHCPKAVFLQIANQADTQTRVAYEVLKKYGFDRHKVISVNDLDKARLLVAVADELHVPLQSVRMEIAGTHDDHMTPLFSTLKVGGQAGKLTQETKEKITEKVRKGGWWMKQQMGFTSAEEPGSVAGSLVRAMLQKSPKTFNLGIFLDEEWGFSGVVMGLPCTVSLDQGATPTDVEISAEERSQLESAVDHAQKMFLTVKK